MVSQSCPDICKCAMHTQLGTKRCLLLDMLVYMHPPVSHLFQSYSQGDRGQWCLCIHSKGPGGSWTGWCIFCIFYPPTSHPPPPLVYFILTSHKSSSAPPPPPPTVCSQLVKDHECYHCLCHLQLPMP